MLHLLNQVRKPIPLTPTRRGFLKLSAGAGAGLALGVSLPLAPNASRRVNAGRAGL